MAHKILVVDDVPFVRKTLTEILTAARYQVIGEAADGLEACDLYAKLRPNLVTMDIVMPRMGGIDATRRLVKMDREARIIMISAMGQESLVMEAINVGAKDFILKPFSSQDVIRAVERALAVEEYAVSKFKEARS